MLVVFPDHTYFLMSGQIVLILKLLWVNTVMFGYLELVALLCVPCCCMAVSILYASLPHGAMDMQWVGL